MAEKQILEHLLEFIVSIWDRIGWLFIIYFGTFMIEYVSGTLVLVKSKRWKAKKTMPFIWRITGSLFAIAIGGVLDLLIDFLNIRVDLIDIRFGNIPMFCGLILIWCIANELGNISKNAKKLGYVVPRFLESGVDKFKENIEDHPDEGSKPDSHAHTE